MDDYNTQWPCTWAAFQATHGKTDNNGKTDNRVYDLEYE
jgi:hypothetical protein